MPWVDRPHFARTRSFGAIIAVAVRGSVGTRPRKRAGVLEASHIERRAVVFGYAGKILRVDLSSGNTTELSTAEYAERFLGGRGMAARLYWEEVPPQAGALDAENALAFATGPLAGVPTFGGSRWVVCAKSPATTPPRFSCCNLGGRWSIDLRSIGYDALLVRGQSDRPVYLLLGEDVAELRDASGLWSRGALQTREALKDDLGSSVSVVAIGPAGENMATMASLVAEDDAAGAGGLGAVMGSKNLKAVVIVRGRQKTSVAQPDRVKELARYFRSLGREPIARAGSLAFRITGPGTKKAPCHGCVGTCNRRTYQDSDGQSGKFMCQAATFYQALAEMQYGPGHEVPFRATKLCDDYGLDTMAMSMIIMWLMRCGSAGILSDDSTGIPISRAGSLDFIETLVRRISFREGFGNILAQGLPEAADQVGPAAREKIIKYLSKAGQPNANDPRLYIHTALLYAMAHRPPMPELQEVSRIVLKWIGWVKGSPGAYVSSDVLRGVAERFWGSQAAADFSTHEGKALAARMIQDREAVKESLVLCSFLWPILELEHTQDHLGDPDLESRVLSAVLGKEVTTEELYRAGERIFNLERAIGVREGHRGREDDMLPESWHTVPLRGDLANPECLVPGKDGQPTSRIGAVIDRAAFERSKDKYYALRSWDVSTGLQSGRGLEALDLGDVAHDLAQRALLRDQG